MMRDLLSRNGVETFTDAVLAVAWLVGWAALVTVWLVTP